MDSLKRRQRRRKKEKEGKRIKKKKKKNEGKSPRRSPQKLRPSRQISLLSRRLTQLGYLLSTFNNRGGDGARAVGKLLFRSRRNERGKTKGRNESRGKGMEEKRSERGGQKVGEQRKIYNLGVAHKELLLRLIGGKRVKREREEDIQQRKWVKKGEKM